MQRLGLALSGGGFRATLYHLGVIRFLRDADILPKITHITTVSGGSVLGAHLVLNWDAYCGADRDFDDAADKLIRFVQMDVRNRIVRRFPFGSLINSGRRILRRDSARQLTRAGLLELHYEKFLYGDIPLSRLPDRPRLHVLTTNLSEGCLCSFNRDGLLLHRRTPSGHRFERVHLGLATVPMAIAASSAFPGFFPPLVLSGSDVGADVGDFSRQAFTDGGVYDNLGLRMFRNLERSSVRDSGPLRRSDFLEFDDTMRALAKAGELPEQTPLRRLRNYLAAFDPQNLPIEKTDFSDTDAQSIVRGFSEILRTEKLFQESAFDDLTLTDPTAQSLLNLVRGSTHRSDTDDRTWLNRQMLDSALRQVVGKPCLKIGHKGFDGIMVSDAGGKFKVTNEVRAGGLVRTALRSTDILMDRVWQLELEAFENSPNVLFFPISEVVRRSQDNTVPDPEIQRQARRIRTDLDRFSPLEVRSLVQHGYCVARKQCRTKNDFFKAKLNSDPPWDPLERHATDAVRRPVDLNDSKNALNTARALQGSSSRRIWRTLFDPRDWTTFIWIPLLICLAVSVPYVMYKQHQHAASQQTVLTAIAETSAVYRQLLDLLEGGSRLDVEPMPYEEVESLPPFDLTGFEIISDVRIFDLRGWADQDSDDRPDVYNRTRVRRLASNVDNTQFRIQRKNSARELLISLEPQNLDPKLYRVATPDGQFLWEIGFDFESVPLGGDAEIVARSALGPELAEQIGAHGRFNFTVWTDTGLIQVWMLLPEKRKVNTFSVRGYPIDQPELAKVVVPSSEVKLPFGFIATFRMINPEPGYHYECAWTWTDEE